MLLLSYKLLTPDIFMSKLSNSAGYPVFPTGYSLLLIVKWAKSTQKTTTKTSIMTFVSRKTGRNVLL